MNTAGPPGRAIATWWSGLTDHRPTALWYGHFDFFRVPVGRPVAVVRPLDPIERRALSALAAGTDVAAALLLGPEFAAAVLRDLRFAGLVSPDQAALTDRGRRALAEGRATLIRPAGEATVVVRDAATGALVPAPPPPRPVSRLPIVAVAVADGRRWLFADPPEEPLTPAAVWWELPPGEVGPFADLAEPIQMSELIGAWSEWCRQRALPAEADFHCFDGVRVQAVPRSAEWPRLDTSDEDWLLIGRGPGWRAVRIVVTSTPAG